MAAAGGSEAAPSQRTGGEHLRQPVLSIVSQASIALCRSIRRRVCGTDGSRHPSVGAHRDPFRMSGLRVGLELNDLLLIGIRQPSLAARLLLGVMRSAIFARHIN